MHPSAPFHMVLDGQQCVQSLLLSEISIGGWVRHSRKRFAWRLMRELTLCSITASVIGHFVMAITESGAADAAIDD
jgi:hypothetical protein